jgi:hypothetical protein
MRREEDTANEYERNGVANLFMTIEGDEVYTRVGENLPPAACEGWTIHFVERETRYWIEAQAGIKNAKLFEHGVKSAWNWAQVSESIR